MDKCIITNETVTDDRMVIMLHTVKVMARHNVPWELVSEYVNLLTNCSYDRLVEITNAIIRLCNRRINHGLCR